MCVSLPWVLPPTELRGAAKIIPTRLLATERKGCNDSAASAQVSLLSHRPRRRNSYPAPGVDLPSGDRMLLMVCSTIVIFLQVWRDVPLVRPMVKKAIPATRETLAANVKAFRKAYGYSQEQLAEHCGLHRTYIGSVEREERNVSLSTLEVLALALGVSVPELLTHRAEHDRQKPK